jgi:hypothetical protein
MVESIATSATLNSNPTSTCARPAEVRACVSLPIPYEVTRGTRAVDHHSLREDAEITV